MAFLSFLRDDEEEEKRRDQQGGFGNRFLSFLDDTADVAEDIGGKVADTVTSPFRDNEDPYDTSFSDVVGVIPETIGDTARGVGDVAEAGTEWFFDNTKNAFIDMPKAILYDQHRIRRDYRDGKISRDEAKKQMAEIAAKEPLVRINEEGDLSTVASPFSDEEGAGTGQFLKSILQEGTGAGLELAPFVRGATTAMKPGQKLLSDTVDDAGNVISKALPSVLKEGATYGTGEGIYEAVRKGETDPAQFAGNVLQGIGGEILGFGAGKLVGKGMDGIKPVYAHYDEAAEATGRNAGGVVDSAARRTDEGTEELVDTAFPGTRQRAFLETVSESPNATDEVAEGARNIEPQKYDVRRNQELFDTAGKAIDQDELAVENKIFNSDKWDDETAASSVQLIDRWSKRAAQATDSQQKNELYEKTFRLIEQVDEKARKAGRANQALTMFNKLTPEGKLRFAQREVRRAVDGFARKKKNKKKLQQVDETANQIKRQLSGGANVERGTVKNALDDIANAADQTTGQKVAKRVEKTVTPQKKKKVDELVNEVTKKIRQEMLPQKGKKKGKEAIEVLRETFGRNKEAQEAFPEAQRILREKFSGNPAVSKQLDTFFKSELGMPAAGSTVNRAIREQLKKNGERVSEIITKSWNNQKQSVDDVAKALTDNGFDQASARQLAEEVTQRLNKQVGDAKTRALKQMMQGAKKSQRATFEDKVKKLSNLGALDDADYLELSRAKLEIPQLTSESARKISQIAQRMQDMTEGSPEYQKAMSEMMDEVVENIPVTWKDTLAAYRYQNMLSGPQTQSRNILSNTFNAFVTRPLTLFSRGLSDAGRAAITGSDRVHYAGDAVEYFKGMINRETLEKSMELGKKAYKGELAVKNPDFEDLYATALGMSKRKKLYRPLRFVSELMEAQDRFYSNMVASGEYETLVKNGMDPKKALDEASRIGEYSLFRAPLDTADDAAQGDWLRNIDKVTEAISNFANNTPGMRWILPFVRTPSNMAKQWVEYSPLGYGTMKGAQNKTEQFAKATMGTSLAVAGASLAMADKTTWAPPTNERDRELFYASGKKPYSVKVGDKWVPMIYTGPFALALAMPAAYKQVSQDDPEAIDRNVAENVMASTLELGRLFSQQTYLQGIGNIVNAISGEDEQSLMETVGSIGSQMIPAAGLQRYVSNVFDPTYRQADGVIERMMRDTPGLSDNLEPYENPLTGEPSTRRDDSMGGVPLIQGVVNPYSIGNEPEDADLAASADMTSEFYESLRQASSGRTETNEEISEALLSGDTAGASALIQEHNSRVGEAFKDFREKYGSQLSRNPELAKEFVSELRGAIIIPSTASIRGRINAEEEESEFLQAIRGGIR